MLVLAALVVAALIAFGLPGKVAHGIQCSVDEILGASSHACSSPGSSSLAATPPWRSANPVTRATWGRYVSLGDSYSAGEGLGPFQPGSDTSHIDLTACRVHVGPLCAVPFPKRVVTDGCHRSARAYGGAVSGSYKFVKGNTFWACSGSTTQDIYDGAGDPNCAQHGSASGRYGEGCQVNRVNKDASLVTLTIGGNDAGFAKDLQTCYQGDLPLQGGASKCTAQGPAIDQRIADMKARLIADLSAIHQRAPHARIIIMTYPQPFASNPTSSAGTCVVAGQLCLSPGDERFLNGKADELDSAVCSAAAAAGVGAECVDARNAFAGCEIGAPNPCVQSPSLSVSLIGSVGAAPGSFHPTAEGQRRLAELIDNEIRNPPPS